MQIEKNDIPEHIQETVNAIRLFNGDKTVVKETGEELCARIAGELKTKRERLEAGLPMEEAFLAEYRKTLPEAQPTLDISLEDLKKRAADLEFEIGRARSIGTTLMEADAHLNAALALAEQVQEFAKIRQIQEGFKKYYGRENGVRATKKMIPRIAEAEAFFRDELPKILRKKSEIPLQ